MKNLRQLQPKPMYFIAAKDTDGNFWVLPWQIGWSSRHLYHTIDWQFIESDTFVNESVFDDKKNYYFHRNMVATATMCLELKSQGPEFWDRALTDYEKESEKLTIVKSTCAMYQVDSQVSKRATIRQLTPNTNFKHWVK